MVLVLANRDPYDPNRILKSTFLKTHVDIGIIFVYVIMRLWMVIGYGYGYGYGYSLFVAYAKLMLQYHSCQKTRSGDL